MCHLRSCQRICQPCHIRISSYNPTADCYDTAMKLVGRAHWTMKPLCKLEALIQNVSMQNDTIPAAMYSTTLMPKCSSTMVWSPATAFPKRLRSSEKGTFTWKSTQSAMPSWAASRLRLSMASWSPVFRQLPTSLRRDAKTASPATRLACQMLTAACMTAKGPQPQVQCEICPPATCHQQSTIFSSYCWSGHRASADMFRTLLRWSKMLSQSVEAACQVCSSTGGCTGQSWVSSSLPLPAGRVGG